MNTNLKIGMFAAAGLTLIAGAGIALAQGSSVGAALSDGSVGEQADGYLGIRGASNPGLVAEVKAINIKRRQVYTNTAATNPKHPTVEEVGAAVGCQTLASLPSGRAYLLPDKVWRVKSGAIALPASCTQP